MDLLFATANTHKCEEAQAILGSQFRLILPAALGLTEDIPETGTTLKENALQKAQYVWDRFGLPCFADDTGLEVDALGGAPGVYTARYAGEHCTPHDNVVKMLHQLRHVPFPQRTARFICAICLQQESGPQYFIGTTEGHILEEERGTHGFGYDPIFQPLGFTQAFAQLSAAQKNQISHRGLAMTQLRTYLLSL